MLFFGKKAAIEADETAKKVEAIKKTNAQKFDKAENSISNLHALLKANGITLRIHIAAGGHHGR